MLGFRLNQRDRFARFVGVFSASALFLMSAFGCGRGSDQEAVQPQTRPVARRVEPVQSVVVDRSIAESPAVASLTVDAVTSAPEEVCRAFLMRLQQSDRIGAETLLTREALTTTRQANLMLEPISGKTASITVKPATFASRLRDTAEVECVITDRLGGKRYESPITWQVRKQGGQWRVSGMRVSLDNDAASEQVLSFESIDDVATIKLLATGEAIQRSESRQADSLETNTTLQ